MGTPLWWPWVLLGSKGTHVLPVGTQAMLCPSDLGVEHEHPRVPTVAPKGGCYTVVSPPQTQWGLVPAVWVHRALSMSP